MLVRKKIWLQGSIRRLVPCRGLDFESFFGGGMVKTLVIKLVIQNYRSSQIRYRTFSSRPTRRIRAASNCYFIALFSTVVVRRNFDIGIRQSSGVRGQRWQIHAISLLFYVSQIQREMKILFETLLHYPRLPHIRLGE